MAEGSLPSGPSVVRLHEEANPNLENLERRRIVSSTATIRATEDEGAESSRLHAEEQASHVVELGDPPANFASNPTSFWARLRTGDEFQIVDMISFKIALTSKLIKCKSTWRMDFGMNFRVSNTVISQNLFGRWLV